jgi:hypothetical protein
MNGSTLTEAEKAIAVARTLTRCPATGHSPTGGTMRTLLALALVALLLLPAFAFAAGPHDGAYSVTQTRPGFILSYYLVVVQNGQNIGFASLFANGAWTYGMGQLTSPTQALGTLYQADGDVYGSFAVTVAPEGVIHGTVVVSGVTYEITGVRFF